MIGLIEQAAEVQRFLDERGWRSCIIGGLAVIRWGEPRFTQDVPFEEDVIDRATDFAFVPGVVLRTVSAEDLVVLKAFANRDRDWIDIAGIASRQQSLDWPATVERLAPLVELKGQPEILPHLQQVREHSTTR